MLPLHLALIADLWIFVIGLVGCYLLLAPIARQAVPAWSVSMVQVHVGSFVVSYGRKKTYYDRQNSW